MLQSKSLYMSPLGLALAVFLVSAMPAPLRAQDDEPAKPKVKKPEEVTLETRDNLELAATYYPGKEAKDTVPIVMLHDYKGNRNDFRPLALYLQDKGHAVLVPDLRGHGDSTKFRLIDGQPRKEIDVAKMRPLDYAAMITQDMQAVRKFILEKNDEAKLNLNALCLVGAGMGAVVGINYAMVDWSYPPLATGKQGQDVKALVLISPPSNFRGVTTAKAIQHPAIQKMISAFLVAGKGRQSTDANRLNSALVRNRPEPEPDKVKEQKDVFFRKLDTKLEGADLLKKGDFQLDANIEEFITLRIVNKDFPWEERMSGN